MKKEISELRSLAKLCKEDELKDTGDEMMLIPRKDMVNAYFDGYEKALHDVEKADPSGGIDLIKALERVRADFTDYAEQAQEAAEGCADDDTEEMNPEQAFAVGCASAYQTALWCIARLLDTVHEAVAERDLKPVTTHEGDPV